MSENDEILLDAVMGQDDPSMQRIDELEGAIKEILWFLSWPGKSWPKKTAQFMTEYLEEKLQGTENGVL